MVDLEEKDSTVRLRIYGVLVCEWPIAMLPRAKLVSTTIKAARDSELQKQVLAREVAEHYVRTLKAELREAERVLKRTEKVLQKARRRPTIKSFYSLLRVCKALTAFYSIPTRDAGKYTLKSRLQQVRTREAVALVAAKYWLKKWDLRAKL